MRSPFCDNVRWVEDSRRCNTYGAGGRVLAAGNVLLALLVDKVLDGDGKDDGDCR